MTAPQAAHAPQPSPQEEQRLEECRAKLKLAASLKVLHDFGWDPPAPPRVVVGPTFITMPIDAKQGFAEAVNCFLAGGGPGRVDFDLLHWQTGRPIYRFAAGQVRAL